MLRKVRDFIRDVKAVATLKRDLGRQIQSLQMDLDVIKANGVNVHNRLDLANQRTAHVEHYLGLRQHQFVEHEKMWGFFQARDDIQKGKRPVSLFHQQQNAQARAKKQGHKHGTNKRVA